MIGSHGQSSQNSSSLLSSNFFLFGGDQIFDISKGIKEGNWNPNSRSTKSKSKEYRRRARPYSKNASIDFCEKLDKNLYWYLLDVKRYVDKAKVKAKQATQRKKS